MIVGPFTVKLDASVDDAHLHRGVLAALPERWRVVETDNANAVLTAGSAEEIAATMAADHRAIVLADPTRLRPEEIDRLLARAGDKINLVAPLELGPRLAADALTSGTKAGGWSIFDSLGQIEQRDDLHHALFEQLTAARFLLGGVEHPLVLQRSDGHYVVSARAASGTALTLAACVTHRRQFSIDLIGTTKRFDIDVDLRAMADPMILTRYDANGAVRSWPVHQSGHRLVWAELAAAIAGGSEAVWTLRRAQEDLGLVWHLLGPRDDIRRGSGACLAC
jgi:hypothetical protein